MAVTDDEDNAKVRYRAARAAKKSERTNQLCNMLKSLYARMHESGVDSKLVQ